MNKYKIKYNYNSGDSFGSYNGLESVLEIYWKNLENAKSNLKRIKEHYEQYKKIKSILSYNEDDLEKIINENKDKDWFFGKKTYKIIDKTNKQCYYMSKVYEDIKEDLDRYEINEVFDKNSAQNYLILYTDNNKPFQFLAPWCGYFEDLNYAEIISEIQESDLKYTA
jgi:hypothetical protein